MEQIIGLLFFSPGEEASTTILFEKDSGQQIILFLTTPPVSPSSFFSALPYLSTIYWLSFNFFVQSCAVIRPFVSRLSSARFVRALCQCVSSPWWWGCAVSHACEHVHLSEPVWHHTDRFAWAAEGEGSQPNIGIHLKFKLKALWSLLYLSVA